MRTLGANNATALSEARDKGIIPVRFFTVTVKDRSNGDPVTFCLFTGDDTLTCDVISGVDGSNDSRDFTGSVNLKIGDIPRASDLKIQEIEVSFSALAPICQSIVREHDPRLARVEIHSGWLSPTSRIMVDEAELDFIGEIDGAPIQTAAAGGESIIKLKVVSFAISMLARTNPRKRSFEGQKLRSGDEFGKYRNGVSTWRVPWGEKESKE